jgi:predicted membrane-bound spermidine synthase
MSTLPVLFLLAYNGVVLFGACTERRSLQKHLILPTALFFFSGMPALIYQIVWQRTLFAIYGVNSESVAVVVSAFMIGLGLGSLLGGWLSLRFPHRAVFLFGIAELCVAVFGIVSLRIFHWAAAHSAGAPLPQVVFFSLALLLAPTVCMGATLPMLADHLVRSSRTVGYSVGLLYFANTFGSAFACYLCATFLLRDLGQSGSVRIAACINVAVAASAIVLGSSRRSIALEPAPVPSPRSSETPSLSIHRAMFLAAAIGFVSLGFEIIWFRVFALASSDRAPAFALLLSTYLTGIAAGSYIVGKLAEALQPRETIFCASMLILTAAGMCSYLTPLVAWLTARNIGFLIAAPAFFLVASILGSIFTLVCRLAIPVGSGAGRRVSLIYVANILGSATGSLVVGFVLLNHFGLRQVTSQLGSAALIIGCGTLFLSPVKLRSRRATVAVIASVSLLALIVAPFLYTGLYEKLILGPRAATAGTFAHVVENRNGVIAVTQNGMVFGGGVYDGFFSTDPVDDKNLIIRAYALSAFSSRPARILMIGLSSGSWAQVLANNPETESLDVVEINPGYLQLIPRYSAVQSLLANERVHITIDDGRRWLLSHPDSQYDVIVQNTTFYWRDHTSELLSADYLHIIRGHLKPGGVFYYNTTGSDDVVATGLSVFPFGLRVVNFLAVSDAPLQIDKQRWSDTLASYTLDGRKIFDPTNPATLAVLKRYNALADSVSQPPIFYGFENAAAIKARIKNPLIITDDNMGWEWRGRPLAPWN